jgi:hypothetical protein
MAYDWNPIEQPVTNFLLDDVPSPGICLQPTGAAIRRKLDERQGYGIDAAFLIYTGRELAEFSTELLLVTPADWKTWQETFRDMIHTVPRRGPVRQSSGGYEPGKSHMIWHPQLFPLGITQCVVLEEPQEVIDDQMVGHVTIKFKQVLPMPKPAYAKPEAPAGKPPMTESEKEIARLTDELASLRQRNAMAGR